MARGRPAASACWAEPRVRGWETWARGREMATRAKTEMRGFVFIIFFSFLLFQIHFQIHFKKHFEILLNFSQTTQVNKN